MLDRARRWGRALVRRARRIERRELEEFRDWLEDTRNLIHVSVLILLPLLIAAVTAISNAVDLLPFLLFPPLASGTYTLFTRPESSRASPRRFVGGLTAGALCGWVALEVAARFWYGVAPETFQVHPGAAAFGLFLTGVVTWGLDIEESQAFSTALLVLVTGVTQLLYVASVLVSTTLIAGAFVVWRRHLYEQRARYFYRSTKGDDRVLVPMRGDNPDETAMLGAHLAAAHEAGKVVLLDVVDDREVAKAERAMLGDDGGGGRDGQDGEAGGDEAERRAAQAAAVRLEERSNWIEERLAVPCEVVVAVDPRGSGSTVLETAGEVDCDLIAVPYEAERGKLTPFVRRLLGADVDVLVHRSAAGAEEWSRALVTVRRPGDVAHAMIDFALRVVEGGRVSVCHCIGSERDRRQAEEMLANLVETFEGTLETRVAREPVEEFLGRNASEYDAVFLGASRDRSRASRFVSRPTFERIEDLDCDVVLIHRG